jgi:hypothetical protein
VIDIAGLSREDLRCWSCKNWLAHDAAGSWPRRNAAQTASELDSLLEAFCRGEASRINGHSTFPQRRTAGSRTRARLPLTRWSTAGRCAGPMTERSSSGWWSVGSVRARLGAGRPCKPVGIVEFSQFARSVDPEIRTECLSCPPDPAGENYCVWRFTLPRSRQGGACVGM